MSTVSSLPDEMMKCECGFQYKFTRDELNQGSITTHLKSKKHQDNMKMKEEDKKNKQKQSSIMDMFSGSRSGRRGGRKRNRNQMDSQSRAQSSTSSVSSSTSNRASNTNIKRPRLIPQKLVFVDNNNTIIDIQDGDMTQVNWCEGIVPDCLVHHPDELDFNNIQQYIPQTTAKQIQVFDNKVHHLKCQKILVDPDPQCKDVNRCCFALHKDTLLERLINKGFIWKGKVNGPHNEDLSEYGKGQKLSIQRNRMVTYRAQLQEKERKFNNSLVKISFFKRLHTTIAAKDTSNVGRIFKQYIATWLVYHTIDKDH
eukprot:123601_1